MLILITYCNEYNIVMNFTIERERDSIAYYWSTT